MASRLYARVHSLRAGQMPELELRNTAAQAAMGSLPAPVEPAARRACPREFRGQLPPEKRWTRSRRTVI